MSRPPLHHTPDNDALFHVDQAASATECTGLMPFMPMTDDESQSLTELESIHPQPGAPDALMHPGPAHDGRPQNLRH